MSDPSTLKERIARLLYGENRANMSPEEALAMGDTVLNRTGLRGYPDDPEQVILQRKQYNPFDPNDPNYKTIMEFGPQDPRWQEYISYAEKILDPARTRSAFTHYFTGEPPVWAGALDGLTQIGSHWFGTEKRRKKTPGGAAAVVASLKK